MMADDRDMNDTDGDTTEVVLDDDTTLYVEDDDADETAFVIDGESDVDFESTVSLPSIDSDDDSNDDDDDMDIDVTTSSINNTTLPMQLPAT